MNKIIENSLVNKMLKDKKIRIAITMSSFLYFFHFYYAHYVKYETADFQKEIMHLLENSSTENLIFVAFRGSGKSTIVTTAYPIWAILGKQQKKFCIVFCQTKAQAKQHMMNIRAELEGNDLLKKDLGPFNEESDEWGSYSLVFKKHNARITVASTEQSIRGLRHNEHRPDLIICDDVEDIQSTKTREGRDKTYNWLRGDVIPSGDKNTRLIIVGNLLHEDSLLMRINSDIKENMTKGIFKAYPIIDKHGSCLWPGKYTSEKELENEKMKVGSESSWQREFMLRIIPNDDQVIYPEWINRYTNLPNTDYRYTYAGIDLAISTKDSADYTTIVSARIYGHGENKKIYIIPNPIMQKITFPEQVDLVTNFSKTIMTGQLDKIFIESVAYQEALPQLLEHHGVKAESVTPKGDKRTRLVLTSDSVKSGMILFPEKGCETLLQQILGFGVEKHDDLVDAFTLMIHKALEKDEARPSILWL